MIATETSIIVMDSQGIQYSVFSVFSNHSESVSLPLEIHASSLNLNPLGMGVLLTLFQRLNGINCPISLCKQVPHLSQMATILAEGLRLQKNARRSPNRGQKGDWLTLQTEQNAAPPLRGMYLQQPTWLASVGVT